MPLTKEQGSIVNELLRNIDHEQVQTLGGYAGTGKTTTLSHLSQRLPTFAPCAFTGRASTVMHKRGMVKAGTIHSLIYNVEEEDGTTYFALKNLPELGNVSGFLVDEASMVGRDLYEDILSFGLPCIFCGDHGQLAPIGSDIYLMKEPMHRLETIHRNAGPIARFAEHLRKGKPARSFAGGKGVTIRDHADLDDNLLQDAGQIIVAYNKSRVGLNERVRFLHGRQTLLEPGDRIICLRNHRRARLHNGLMGVVIRVDLQRNLLDFQDEDGKVYHALPFDPGTFGQESPELDYHPNAPHPFEYANAITCHKSQGGEWDRVTVVEQKCQHWEHARWAYTAASRAKKELTWVAAPERPVYFPAKEQKPPKATSPKGKKKVRT